MPLSDPSSTTDPGEEVAPLGWLSILRLALVQTALGAMVVLTTSTMNRVMMVELALPAMLPGGLVAAHYAIQMARPRFGHGADGGRRRTPFIVGGLAVLALGTIGAAGSVMVMGTYPTAGILAAVVAFLAIGAGVGASGTNLLTLVATRVAPARRAPAATLMWIMMIVGFVVTTGIAGRFLDPYSAARLVTVTAFVAAIAFGVGTLAVLGIERRVAAPTDERPDFRTALGDVWHEKETRRFTLFVFVSMLAYSAQDLVLEPFAGFVFAMTPGETTLLSSAQNGGVVVGMVFVALVGGLFSRRAPGILRAFCIVGCIGSAASLVGLALTSVVGVSFALRATVAMLGLFNGIFAVAAIGTMMELAGKGTKSREGVRMGLWGAAQAVAFGSGGFFGTVVVDLSNAITGSAQISYAIVFAVDAALFVAATGLAAWAIARPRGTTVEIGTRAEALPA